MTSLYLKDIIIKVLPRFELGSQDSKSWVLTITPQNQGWSTTKGGCTYTVYQCNNFVDFSYILTQCNIQVWNNFCSLTFLLNLLVHMLKLTLKYSQDSKSRAQNISPQNQNIATLTDFIHKWPMQIQVLVHKQGSAEIWTRIAGFRVLSANHYTTEPPHLEEYWLLFLTLNIFFVTVVSQHFQYTKKFSDTVMCYDNSLAMQYMNETHK